LTSPRQADASGAGSRILEGVEHRYAVVVAGGPGTRLWPLSRQSLPKQMQALMSDKTLIRETVDRIRGVVPMSNVFISTTTNYCQPITALLPDVPPENVICEPTARGTAAAFALFASVIHEKDPGAIVFSLASDHAIAEVEKFHAAMRQSFAFVESNPRHVAMVGVRPTRPDTGLGYIRARHALQRDPLVLRAEKFVEKPTRDVAQKYAQSGEYFWNAAYYCFSTQTLLEAYEDADPTLVQAARNFSKTGDRADYEVAPDKTHEIEIIDSTTYPLALVPADFTWSDIGNWPALYNLKRQLEGDDQVRTDSSRHVDVASSRLMVSNADGRLVATAGLDDIAIITTEDAVLVVNMAQLERDPLLMKRLLDELVAHGQDGYL
jgi:mannose-1-phosphate guanylyltransferase/mannose-6-phosphate isomerase